MSTEGWVFMVGFRIFDVGLLVLWLVWFFRLRDDGDDRPDDGGPGGGGPGKDPGGDSGGGGGLGLPLGRFGPGARHRDGHGPHPFRPAPRRGGSPPIRRPLPARVRRPSGPVPVRRA
ncbi:MAG TPA: hypothetical protein VNT32_08055 [Thermoleophilaceae bacterium]|nr:hypothetical protein [Thermoleophilaceae bacterium]